MTGRSTAGRKALPALWVVAIIAGLTLLAPAPPAAASVPAGLPPGGLCIPRSGDTDYCWDANNHSMPWTSTGHLADGGTATIGITPTDPPCASTNHSPCYARISYRFMSACIQDRFDGAGWTHSTCTSTANGQFKNTAGRFNPFLTGNFMTTPTQECGGAYNNVYGPGGPPGSEWPVVAPQYFECDITMKDANKFVEMYGDTWLVFRADVEMRVNGVYGAEVHSVQIPVRLSGSRPIDAEFVAQSYPSPSLTADFTNSSTGEPGHALSYVWTFGDGATSTATSPSHTYAAPGNYFVNLKVTDTATGWFVNTGQTVEVPSTAHILKVTCGATQTGPGGSQMAFTSAVTGAESTVTYDWTFGDGTTATTPSVSRTATEPGTFTASLTVDDGDETATTTCNEQVQPPPLSVDIAFAGGADFAAVGVGDTTPVKVTLRAGANGLGDLSDVHFVGTPLVIDPEETASVVSGPTPPVPAGLTMTAGSSRTFTFSVQGDEPGWFELLSTATATDSAGASVGEKDGDGEGIVTTTPLEVTMTAEPADTAAPGQEIDVTLDVKNIGDSDLFNVEPFLDADWQPEEPSDDPAVSGPTPEFVDDLAPDQTVTFEATVTPPADGVLTLTGRATAIDDNTGDFVASNQPEEEIDVSADLVVNSTGDTDDEDAGDEICDTGDTIQIEGEDVPECTLRAAISEANAGDLDDIEFDIDGTPVINPDAALPTLLGPATLDGTTQPEGPVQLSGGSLGDGVVGLTLGGSEVTVLGMSITGFDGPALEMGGDGSHVLEQSLIGVARDGTTAGGNGAGIRVISPGNRIGGTGEAGNTIANNSPTEAPEPPPKGAGEEAVKAKVEDLPANVLVIDDGSADVVGNDIEVGIAVAAIGALGEGGVQFTDNTYEGAIGVVALVSDGSVTASGNEMKALIGSLAIVKPGSASFTYDDNDLHAFIGALMLGTGDLQFTNNRLDPAGIGVISVLPSDQTKIEGNTMKSVVGVLSIASLGSSVSGNTFDGVVGVLSIGTGSVIAKGPQYDDNDFITDIGMLVVAEDSAKVTNNTFTKPDGIALFMLRTQATTIADNTISAATIGMGLINVGGADIARNTITGTKIAALVAADEPTAEEKDLGNVSDAPTDESELEDKYTEGDAQIGIDWANSAQQVVEIDESMIYSTPVNGALNNWTGNTITGNYMGLLMAGAVDANMIGGTGPGDGNTISGNKLVGLLLGGDPGPAEVTIRGNAIFGNGTESFEDFPAGVPDIKLLAPGADEGTVAGATPNDPGDADTGANGVQNHPLITSVERDGSSVSGELWSTASTNFLVDLYATSTCHSSGHGGGERYLGEVLVSTNGSGKGTFTKAISVGAGEQVTATATATGGFVDGATSEFSRCAPLGLVATGTSEPAEAGDEKIEVGTNEDFDIGDEVTINPGAPNEETAIVTGFGSLILAAPLAFDHAAGELVVAAVQPPGPPRTIKGVAGNRKVTVSWLAPLDDGGADITGYKVTNDKNGRTCQTTGALSCTVMKLQNGVKHRFQVVAVNAAGQSIPSTKSAAVVPRTVPTAPRDVVVAMKTGGKAVLGWKAPSSTGGVPIQRYRVVAAPGGKSCSTATRSCTVTGLAKGTKYAFSVTAQNAAGTGPAAKTAKFKAR